VNGVVLLDLSNPAHPTIASRFDEQLTGGVHNSFATNDYLYAISGGDKYVIIDVKDIKTPKFAGEYNHPNSRIHDVWVNDGIAYSSEWGTGVVAVTSATGNTAPHRKRRCSSGRTRRRAARRTRSTPTTRSPPGRSTSSSATRS